MQRVYAAGCCAVLAGSLAAGGAAAAPHPTLTTHVPDIVLNHSAVLVGAPASNQVMELAISLPLHVEAGLKALIARLYDPTSSHFRHYLSVAAFADQYCPTAAAYASVKAFAKAHNLTIRNDAANRRVLVVSGTVADVQRAFNVTIKLYRDQAANRTFYAPANEPTTDLATPVLHITGLDNQDVPASHLIRGQPVGVGTDTVSKSVHTGSGPKGNFTGNDVRIAYYGGTALTGAGQSVGLVEYGGYNIVDVQTYFAEVGQPLNVPVKGVSVDGALLRCQNKCDDSEQVLDIEEAISMAPGLDQVVVYVGHNDVAILNQMASDNSSAQLSSSWGWKPDPESDDPIFEEFAAQGQTLVDATGDYGYRLKADAVWPGDDQYVTGVGGTDLVTDGPGGAWARETGWAGSGGGHSPDHIALPSYQLPIVNRQNHASRKLRNVPDVAGDADIDNYSCYDGGCSTGNGGTSYAAPLMAGFVALVNQQGAAQGMPPVGFINPMLYLVGLGNDHNTVFHDEVNGYNGRFHAMKDFDLVTGWGSPHGQALIDALLGTK